MHLHGKQQSCALLGWLWAWVSWSPVWNTKGNGSLKNPESFWERSNISNRKYSIKNLFTFLLALFSIGFHHLLYYFLLFVISFKESVQNPVSVKKCHERFSFCCIFTTICPWLNDSLLINFYSYQPCRTKYIIKMSSTVICFCASSIKELSSTCTENYIVIKSS